MLVPAARPLLGRGLGTWLAGQVCSTRPAPLSGQAPGADSPAGEDPCTESTGVLGAGFLFCYLDKPLCSRASSQPAGVHRQREDAPRAMPSRCGDLKYAVKEGPGFVLIFLPYCLLLYKRLQFKINRSDSQLMWYSGRPEFLLLWQWSSAHLFCR